MQQSLTIDNYICVDVASAQAGRHVRLCYFRFRGYVKTCIWNITKTVIFVHDQKDYYRPLFQIYSDLYTTACVVIRLQSIPTIIVTFIFLYVLVNSCFVILLELDASTSC